MNAPPDSEPNSVDDDSVVRIFVGAHEHELLALKVLEYSIVRHTDLAVAVRTVDNTLAPMPADPRFAPYTRFSYGRFAIPKLVGYRGRAIYMDSDMLVFRDIAEVWNTAFDGAKILIEKQTRRSRKRGRSTAFMMMDCAALRWEPEEIIAGLGVHYDYEQLMSIDPLLEDGDLRDGLPLGWNSLDRMNDETRLLHFTRVKTQPWVVPPPSPRSAVDGGGEADARRGRLRARRRYGPRSSAVIFDPPCCAELGLDEEPPRRRFEPEAITGARPQRRLRAAQGAARRDRARARRRVPSANASSTRGATRAGRGLRRWRKFWRHPVRNLLNPL